MFVVLRIPKNNLKARKEIFMALLALSAWILIYHYLQPVTDWLIDSALHLEKGKRFTEALRFFIFEVPKVLLLLALIIFFVGIIRSWFSPERTRKILEGRSQHLQVT